MSAALVLFRRDLRLSDNPAWTAACAAHAQVLPVFVHAPAEEAPWAPWAAGAASRWWLHHSLASLQADLQRQRGSLHLCLGDSLTQLRELLARSGASAVYWNRLYEPAAIARDTALKAALREQGVTVHSHCAALWSEPWQISTQPGERGARELLELFGDDALNAYAQARDLPARHGTSRLSPHLHFGEISPRQIHAGLQRQLERQDARRRPDIEPYLRELGWREFAHHLLYHFPHTPTGNFNPRFDGFRWADDDAAQLMRWQQGRTGIPLVDAGMRELWHTGWMHNRVRMIVASFLTKNLRQHWLHGARWFWDTLVDADLANNTLGWQWVAGCGADAAPYFRVFNPITQSVKFDPDGAYLKRWLPELAQAPRELLQQPWQDPSLLARSGYPAPMLDLAQSRQQALAAYQSLRGQ